MAIPLPKNSCFQVVTSTITRYHYPIPRTYYNTLTLSRLLTLHFDAIDVAAAAMDFDSDSDPDFDEFDFEDEQLPIVTTIVEEEESQTRQACRTGVPGKLYIEELLNCKHDVGGLRMRSIL